MTWKALYFDSNFTGVSYLGCPWKIADGGVVSSKSVFEPELIKIPRRHKASLREIFLSICVLPKWQTFNIFKYIFDTWGVEKVENIA